MLPGIIPRAPPGVNGVRVAITAYDCYRITREDLLPAFFAFVLAGAVIDRVNMTVTAHNIPFSVQASSGRAGSS